MSNKVILVGRNGKKYKTGINSPTNAGVADEFFRHLKLFFRNPSTLCLKDVAQIDLGGNNDSR